MRRNGSLDHVLSNRVVSESESTGEQVAAN